ncbi:glycine zipper family protein [Lysobacter sp. 2RAF19]
MRTLLTSFAVVLFAFAVLPASAQKPSAYPSKGQTAEQKTQDDAACATWAKQDTGIDPAATAAAPPPATGPQGERARGAVRGAAAGAVIGEVHNGDSSDGAKIGATAGVVAGGRAARRNQAARTQQSQQAQSDAHAKYWSAWGACMAGKGYSVS